MHEIERLFFSFFMVISWRFLKLFFFWLANLKIRVQEKWEALEYLYFKTGGLGEINDSLKVVVIQS